MKGGEVLLGKKIELFKERHKGDADKSWETLTKKKKKQGLQSVRGGGGPNWLKAGKKKVTGLKERGVPCAQ